MKKEEQTLNNAEKPKLGIFDVMHSYTPNYLHFRVNGAGKIQITEDCQYSCGNEKGFSFGVEWGKHGFAGGVLPKEEARRLAEHILNALK